MVSSKPLPLKVYPSPVPGPQRFVSNTTSSWWTEYNSSNRTWCAHSLWAVILHTSKQAKISPFHHAVQTSFLKLRKQSYTLQGISQNYFLSLLSQRPKVSLILFHCSKKTQVPAFPAGLGEIPLQDGQTWPQTQLGRCWTHPACFCSSESWDQSERAESPQGRPEEHRPRTSRHSTKVLATTKAKPKKPASFLISILHFESMRSLEETG